MQDLLRIRGDLYGRKIFYLEFIFNLKAVFFFTKQHMCARREQNNLVFIDKYRLFSIRTPCELRSAEYQVRYVVPEEITMKLSLVKFLTIY